MSLGKRKEAKSVQIKMLMIGAMGSHACDKPLT
jgi:hypothetical protein